MREAILAFLSLDFGKQKKAHTVFIAVLLAASSSIYAAPETLTFQSRIIKPDGQALEASAVNFRFSITDTVGSCVIYQEDFDNRNMTGSKGLINLALGAGSKVFPVAATNLSDVFNNFNSPTLNCLAGGNITAGATDRRKLIVQFNDGLGWQTLPAMDINSNPFALQARSAHRLGNFPAADYVRTAAFPTCVGSEALHFNGASFTCVPASGGGGSVANGGNTGVMTVGTNDSNPLNFETDGSTRMTIDATGNVGIGGSAVPTATLSTTTSGAKTSSIASNVIENTATSSTASINKVGLDIQSTGVWNGASAANIGLNVNVGGGTNNYAALFNGGNVGIGTAAPTARLQIIGSDSNGSANAPSVVSVTGGAGTSGFVGGGISLTGGPAGVNTGEGGAIALQGGTDGIATGGSISLTGAGGRGANPGNTPGIVTIAGGHAGNGQSGGDVMIDGGAKSGGGSDGDVLLATTRGRVGVGTTSPGYKLQVNSTAVAGYDGIYVQGDGAGNPFAGSVIHLNTANDTRGRGIFMTTTAQEAGASWFAGVPYLGGGYQIGVTSYHGAENGASPYIKGAAKLYVSNAGNVGIGTTTPAEALDINGAVKIGSTGSANAGTIRWDGINFQGYNGSTWQNFIPQAPPATACDTTQTLNIAGNYTYTVPNSFGTITVRLWGGGGGGGAGASNGTDGQAGGTTSVMSLSLVALGGSGGTAGRGSNGTGGAGGLSSGGDVNSDGETGINGFGATGGQGGGAPNGGAPRSGPSGFSPGYAGNAPGGGGSGAAANTGFTAGGGGSGSYTEKVFTPLTLLPNASISDIVVGSGGAGGQNGQSGGAGAVGRVTIECNSVGAPIANDRSVQFINAGSYSSDTNFIYDVAGNLGIGTSTPDDKLQVSGGGVLLDNNQYLSFGAAPADTGVSGDGISDTLNFLTGGQTRVAIDSNGQMGVGGTFVPGRTLDITPFLTGTVSMRLASKNGGTSPTLLTMGDSGADTLLFGLDDLGGSSLNGSESNAAILATTSAKPLQLGTQGTVRLTIRDDGNVGIGETDPQTKLQVDGVIAPATDGGPSLGSGTYRFSQVFAMNGVINTSDRREKKDIDDIELGLDFIQKLRPVSYRWKNRADHDVHYGLIAQETEKVLQDFGKNERNSIVTKDATSGRYGVRYSELISPIIKSVQEIYELLVGLKRETSLAKVEADQRIENLELENQILKKQNESMQQRLSEIERQLGSKR